ncbi:MAG TPA: hypothetical protein VFU81_01980, partial [Thermomicrobiales bacterium]|nr:hypothetical protein [Thermomicrobiales bacterium]
MDAILATKLFIPQPRPDVVMRPRLDAALDGIVRHKLTLLAAPAGFGKTTALGAWRATPAGGAAPLAWVSLDAGDNDPARFWSYVATALEALHAGSGEPALAGLRAPQAPPAETILVGIVNALADLDRDAVLVLDDYHAIETAAIHAALAFLLAHLPPRLHLVVASRFDPPLPLARLRAAGALLELRSNELRFTPAETARLLVDSLGLDLAPEDVSALAGRTEGWAAALQLAALSLRGRADAHASIAAFAGSHRYLVDYLGDEVLARQSAETQRFLLEVAILDRLCGPLCDAVIERADGQAMLEWLERANLFIDPLDDERRWYRFHHLFGEFLRARAIALLPERLPALHARASLWLAQAGMTPEAIAHALAAGDIEEA